MAEMEVVQHHLEQRMFHHGLLSYLLKLRAWGKLTIQQCFGGWTRQPAHTVAAEPTPVPALNSDLVQPTREFFSGGEQGRFGSLVVLDFDIYRINT